MLDRGGEHEPLHAGRVLFVCGDDAFVALPDVDGLGQLPDHEVAAARRDVVEVDARCDGVRFHGHEVARVDSLARVHRVDDLLEHVDEPDAVAAVGRRGEAEDHRFGSLREHRVDDRAVGRCRRVVRFVDHEQRDAALEAGDEVLEPFLGEGLHRRDHDVALFGRAALGLLDADHGLGVLDAELVDELLDELVAVRDDDGDVAGAQRQQLRQRRDDDGLAEPGRERHELRAHAARAVLEDGLLGFDLIRTKMRRPRFFRTGLLERRATSRPCGDGRRRVVLFHCALWRGSAPSLLDGARGRFEALACRQEPDCWGVTFREPGSDSSVAPARCSPPPLWSSCRGCARAETARTVRRMYGHEDHRPSIRLGALGAHHPPARGGHRVVRRLGAARSRPLSPAVPSRDGKAALRTRRM